MLENLHVKNLALIEEENITFLDGLHILSGETGAGKSIILGALNLALGAKADKEMLRDSSSEGLVEAIFRVTKEEQKKELEALDIVPYDDQVILTRKITENRSVAKINGEAVPALRMKEVGAVFLDIYGQHEHQSLLQKRKHLELLDQYAKKEAQPIKEQLKLAYQTYVEKQKEWENANTDETQRARELSFLEHEVNEILGANLKPNEDEELEALYRKLSNNKKIMESLSAAYEETGSRGASDGIGRAIRELRMVAEYDESIQEMVTVLDDVDALLNDFNRDLSQYMADAEFDAGSFAEIEDRLNEINRLKDKYGATVEDVLSSCQEKQKRMEQLQGYESYLEQLKRDLDVAKNEVENLSSQLSDVRKKYALQLSEQVRDNLMDLNFLDVSFDMSFSPLGRFTPDGFDDAEFMICLNPGEPMRPLKDVASGGEMSRVMLAIKTVLAENDAIDTLVFDEIDAGISGRTAQAVSEKLSLVAKNHQVICITHLPQIAAMADQHYLIEKDVVNGSTVSSIQALSYHDSVKELARMLGGSSITQAVIDNAKEMKELAMSQKNND
ncbi:MAG: DNA repair protein RecN [Lachnospiraceae bacterium]|nr:DNA repair protein RecN [Lachnospiraceae bacterium]